MKEKDVPKPISPEEILAKIYVFRDKKVMIDSDLAFLYDGRPMF